MFQIKIIRLYYQLNYLYIDTVCVYIVHVFNYYAIIDFYRILNSIKIIVNDNFIGNFRSTNENIKITLCKYDVKWFMNICINPKYKIYLQCLENCSLIESLENPRNCK